jgi:hypothetical protein
MVTLTGTTPSPGDLLRLFVITPWFAFAAGVVIGLIRRFWPNEKRGAK